MITIALMVLHVLLAYVFAGLGADTTFIEGYGWAAVASALCSMTIEIAHSDRGSQ